MAWIHKETNDVVQEFMEGFNSEDFFHVDDLLAIPVAELNKKGYATVESCAGHPFPVVTIVDMFVELGKVVQFDCLAESILTDAPNGETIPTVHRTYARRISYIKFAEPLPEEIGIPQGWNYDSEENFLYTRYRKNGNAYAFTNDQLKKIDELLLWIEESSAKDML